MFGKKKLQEGIYTIKESVDIGDALDIEQHSYQVEVSESEQPTNLTDNPEVLTEPIISKPSVLSYGFEFEGSIKSSGTLIISGKVTGDISAGSLTVENEGLINGRIYADTLNVKGSVVGEIHCRELTVGPNAHVDANSHFDTLQVQRGGKITGLLNRPN